MLGATLLSACQAAHTSAPDAQEKLNRQEVFMMRPVLQDARIFMRRTGTVASGDRLLLRDGEASYASKKVIDMLPPHKWVNLGSVNVVASFENQSLQEIVERVVRDVEVYTGPWKVEWRIDAGDRDILTERFSLNVETTFDEFASYLSDYILNHRGFGLEFQQYKTERILVIRQRG